MTKTSKRLRLYNKKKLMIILWLFVTGQIISTILFDLFSLVIVRGDSYFYLNSASEIYELSSFQSLYSGYIWLLYVSQFISSSGLFMVLIQSIFVILGSYALFSLAKEFGGPIAAWLSVCFYLLNPMLSQWTRYILTESVFFSLIIIGLRLVTLRAKWTSILMIPVLLLLITLRPNGIIIACALLTLMILNQRQKMLLRYGLFISTWLLGTLFALFVLDSGSTDQLTSESSLFRTTLEGEIVYGVNEISREMPQPSDLDRSNSAFLRYIIENPTAIFQIGVLRIYWELRQTRPWYSPSLNLFLTIKMISFYVFSAIGLMHVFSKPLVKAIAVMTLPSAVLIALTWAIWEGRFGWWFLVTWIPLFGIGLSKVIEKALIRVKLIARFPELDRLFRVA